MNIGQPEDEGKVIGAKSARMRFLAGFFVVFLMASSLVVVVSFASGTLILAKNSQGGAILKIEEEKKAFLKKVARKVSAVVYREATIHNPSGDLLPDALDDRAISIVKGRVE